MLYYTFNMGRSLHWLYIQRGLIVSMVCSQYPTTGLPSPERPEGRVPVPRPFEQHSVSGRNRTWKY